MNYFSSRAKLNRPQGGFLENYGKRCGKIYKKIESCLVTIFVDNLPMSMSKSWLWQIFDLEGYVIDVFLSREKKKVSS